MPKRNLAHTGGHVFHVMNRAARRARLFETADDYLAFIAVIAEAQQRIDLPLLAYCVMPNHFHLVAWPCEDEQLPRFMCWFQSTHGRRWNVFRGSRGAGAVYQGRYRASAIQTDRHFLTVCRYVERNALRAGLVTRAQDWAWSSLFERCKNSNRIRLAAWPISPSPDWVEFVNQPQTAGEVEAIRKAVQKNAPFGGSDWVRHTAKVLDLEQKLHPQGRPRKLPGNVLRKP